MDDYWEQIELTQAMLRLQAPTTAQGVIDVLKTYDPQATSFSGDAFYSGANADHSLAGALAEAGWSTYDYNAHYNYRLRCVRNERLHYCEGDVFIVRP